jgi:hypothetical protein
MYDEMKMDVDRLSLRRKFVALGCCLGNQCGSWMGGQPAMAHTRTHTHTYEQRVLNQAEWLDSKMSALLLSAVHVAWLSSSRCLGVLESLAHVMVVSHVTSRWWVSGMHQMFHGCAYAAV